MKIAVTTVGPSLDEQVETRFGRTPYYLFVDTETMEFEAMQNPNVAAGGGAGIQSAQLMSDHGVRYVLTGNCGPNAFQVFSAAGIQVIVGVSGIARQAIEQFKTGVLTTSNQPNVASHFGMGGGRGMGMGGGRGMGRGMGAGQTGIPGTFAPQGEMTDEEGLDVLKEQARILQEQLKHIERQIGAIDKKKGK